MTSEVSYPVILQSMMKHRISDSIEQAYSKANNKNSSYYHLQATAKSKLFFTFVYVSNVHDGWARFVKRHYFAVQTN